jgi:hypothetical protein
MTNIIADILAFVCGAAGWFYMFYSKAAVKLTGIEPEKRNSLRLTLRRVCGGALFVLGADFILFNAVDPKRNPGMFMGVLLAALLLLLVVVVLAFVDLRLTLKLGIGGNLPCDDGSNRKGNEG